MIRNLFILLFSKLFLFGVAYAGVAIPAQPDINASNYLLMDFNSGKILAEKNIDQKVPPASLTKMMTAYVVASELATGNISLDTEVIVSEKAWKMPGSRMFIEVNKKVSISDLLHGVIIQSGNDASVTLAEHVSGSEENFAVLMGKYADQLGMKNSYFTNSTGLPDEQHYTTAEDMAILAAALIRDVPEIYAMHSIKEFTFNNITQQNRNKLLGHDPSVDGIKTGHTDSAGFCLVASAKQDNMRLISVVMGTKSDAARFKASQSLFRYGFRFYETQKLYAANEKITFVRIWKGNVDFLELGVVADLYATFPRGRIEQLNTEFDLLPQYIAPVEKGTVQGDLRITLEGNGIEQVQLIALQSVQEGGIIVKLRDNIQLLFE